LQQAYDDAELSDDLANDFEPALRIQARGYLRADSGFEAALKLICDYADVPADRVVLWARKQYPIAA
jgi:hypothetical protein